MDKMHTHHHLITNEELKKKFSSNFDLANFAIDLAKSYIKQGAGKTLTEIIEELYQLKDEKRE